MNNNSRGQSLFEVLFAIAIAAIVLVGVVSLSTTSIRNTSYSNNNAQATKYVQEATEWLRQERDSSGWVGFACIRASSGGTKWCLNSNSWVSGGCSDKISGTPFSREAILTLQDSDGGIEDVVEAKVTVSWTDAQGEHEVKSITRFTNWQEAALGACPTATPP